MRSASALPEPNTTVVRAEASWGQRVQVDACWKTAFSSSRRSAAEAMSLTLSGASADVAQIAAISAGILSISRYLDARTGPATHRTSRLRRRRRGPHGHGHGGGPARRSAA